jgi:hypothetical protein
MILYQGGSYRVNSVILTNQPLATFYEYLGMTMSEYFNIHTQTLTNVDVAIEGTLDDIHWLDITNNLFGNADTPITSLESDTEYLADTYMTYKDLRLAITPTNASNAVSLQTMIKKGGGR